MGGASVQSEEGGSTGGDGQGRSGSAGGDTPQGAGGGFGGDALEQTLRALRTEALQRRAGGDTPPDADSASVTTGRNVTTGRTEASPSGALPPQATGQALQGGGGAPEARQDAIERCNRLYASLSDSQREAVDRQARIYRPDPPMEIKREAVEVCPQHPRIEGSFWTAYWS